MHIKRERRCVACRQTKQQNEMLRISRINNEYIIDSEHKLGGRGAYVCLDNNCINLAIKKHLFNRAFKTNIDASLYEKIKEYEKDN